MARRLLVGSSVRSERRSLSRPRLSVPSVNVLDRMLMQVLRLGDDLVRYVPTQGADGLDEPVRISQILGQPVCCSTFTPRQRVQTTRHCLNAR